jgi:hypothetical protein
MSRHLLGLLAAGMVLFLTARVSRAGDKEEMVENPFYKAWANAKPGARVVHIERTKLKGAESALLPDGVDEKRIEYKVIDVSDKRVVLELVVTEKQFFGAVQSAPTRQMYPARLKKSNLDKFFLETGAKKGTDTVSVKGKEFKCHTIEGTSKSSGGEEVQFKVWVSDEVPGSIVKKVRTTRQNGEFVAQTTVILAAFKRTGE